MAWAWLNTFGEYGPELILNPHLPLLFLNKSLPSVCHPGVILSRSLPINLEKFSRASFGAWHPTNLDTYIHKTEMTDCDNCPGFCAFPTEFSVSKKLVYVLKKNQNHIPTHKHMVSNPCISIQQILLEGLFACYDKWRLKWYPATTAELFGADVVNIRIVMCILLEKHREESYKS